MTVIPARSAPLPATDRRASTGERLHRAGRILALSDTIGALLTIVVASLVPGGIERGAPALLFVPLWVSVVALTGEYRLPSDAATRVRRLATVSLALPIATLLTTEAMGYPLSAATVTAVCFTTAALGGVARSAVNAAARRGMHLSGVTHRVVIVGTADALPRLLGRLRNAGQHRFCAIAACVAVGEPDDLDGMTLVRGLAACADAARVHGADAVVLAPDPAITPQDEMRLRWALEEAGIGLFVWSGLHSSPRSRTRLALSDDLPLLHLGAPQRLGSAYVVKRVSDRVLAVAALTVLAPVLLTLAVLIRLDSPGPAFFRQTRVGKDDMAFSMWKLRTMSRDADATLGTLADANQASGPLFKIHGDPRITRVGRWLRRTSLDELPQLINVALGQMSLVGPRPALPSEVELYHPDVRHRLVVHPGMTGLWQVSGRSDLSWEDTMRLDQEYVDDWSLLLDLRIAVRTFGAVVRGRGAY